MVVNDCGSQASSRAAGSADRGRRLVMHNSGRHDDGEGSAVNGRWEKLQDAPSTFWIFRPTKETVILTWGCKCIITKIDCWPRYVWRKHVMWRGPLCAGMCTCGLCCELPKQLGSDLPPKQFLRWKWSPLRVISQYETKSLAGNISSLTSDSPLQ